MNIKVPEASQTRNIHKFKHVRYSVKIIWIVVVVLDGKQCLFIDVVCFL